MGFFKRQKEEKPKLILLPQAPESNSEREPIIHAGTERPCGSCEASIASTDKIFLCPGCLTHYHADCLKGIERCPFPACQKEEALKLIRILPGPPKQDHQKMSWQQAVDKLTLEDSQLGKEAADIIAASQDTLMHNFAIIQRFRDGSGGIDYKKATILGVFTNEQRAIYAQSFNHTVTETVVWKVGTFLTMYGKLGENLLTQYLQDRNMQ